MRSETTFSFDFVRCGVDVRRFSVFLGFQGRHIYASVCCVGNIKDCEKQIMFDGLE